MEMYYHHFSYVLYTLATSLALIASWFVFFSPSVRFTNLNSHLGKCHSTHNIKVIPIDVQTQSNYDFSAAVKATTVLQLSDVAYFVQEFPELSINITLSEDWAPATIINSDNEAVTSALLKLKLDHFKTDDVFSPSFMTTIVLITEHGLRGFSDEIFAFLSSQGCKELYIAKPGSIAWAEGPYFYSSRGFFAAWRLYADSGESFIASTIPSQKDNRTYSTLTASAYGTHALTIAVPSRLRYKPSSEKPLAGMRVGVKDVLDLKGVRTGNGNRAYAQCYPPSRHSTDFMDMMIGQGAIFVGKTKTVEFAANQEVVADWVDYSYPFNPRGDFYIGATGSSTGSAAALGTYPWLDFTLGTDGGGSVRDPAVSNGVYGLRPTHNGKQEPGALIPCPSFQTVGYFARSLAELLTIGKFWCQWKSIKNKKFNVKKILMPPEYYVPVSEIQENVEKFASALSEHLHAELVRTPLEDLWSSHRPLAISEPFFSYVEKTFIDVLTHDYYEITSDFREDYDAHFDHKPYVSPPTQWIWQKGSSITPERLKSAHEEVKTHNEWFLNHVMRDKDPKASTLMIVPRYYDSHRDDHLPVPNEREFYGFDSNLHASFSGVPNIVIPIGQAKYKSHITDKVELLPFSASIIGAKGTDLALIEMLLEFLPLYGINTSVLTGKTAFEVKSVDLDHLNQ